MTKRLFCGLIGITIATAIGASAAAQSKAAPLQGVWQTVELTITGPGARTITLPEPLANLSIFSGRHYTRVEVQTEKPRPVLAAPATATADELRATWGPFVAEAGTFEVTDNTITMRPIASKNPAVMGPGVVLTYSFKIEGKTMWVTQVRNQTGPFPNPYTAKLVRVE
jgi:hypothetical protein